MPSKRVRDNSLEGALGAINVNVVETNAAGLDGVANTIPKHISAEVRTIVPNIPSLLFGKS